MRKIAIYGKGGIGKSTTTANISASLAEAGHNVLQIGCDPKHDSTRTLMGDFIPTVLDVWRSSGRNELVIEREDIIFSGFRSVQCVEAGGPTPGVGCAGRGVIRTMDILTDLGTFEEDFSFVFFDVLGDVVCGGFAKPVQNGYAEETYIVTSGEFMALYAANNIAAAMKNIGSSGSSENKVTLGGIIGNLRGTDRERELLEEFATRLNVPLVHCIPRDPTVQNCERMAQTVLEGAPKSEIAEQYRTLARKIAVPNEFIQPTPMSFQELVVLCKDFGWA